MTLSIIDRLEAENAELRAMVAQLREQRDEARALVSRAAHREWVAEYNEEFGEDDDAGGGV